MKSWKGGHTGTELSEISYNSLYKLNTTGGGTIHFDKF